MGVSGAVSAGTKHRVWKAHMKMALANERTLIAWVRVGATYGAGAVVATMMTKEMVNDNHGFTLTVQALLGLLVIAWGTMQFVRRGKLLAERWHGSYESNWGPAIFTIASVISVLLTAGVSIRRIQEYYSDTCPYLPGLNHTPNALPPFFYLTFHGSANPRKAMCRAARGVSGVHRFTLSGDYAGPATNQRDALMHMPRGMTATTGLLVVADSWAPDSSLVFFGACVNAGLRPYLGRIRPESKATRNAFQHPYSVVNVPDEPARLKVSSQDGGAIISVDTISGEMSVEKQVSRIRPTKGSKLSGPLRGLAIDRQGCEHVADRHADAVWHYCKDNAVTMTKLSKPVGLYADGALLYVGSFDKQQPAVYALDLLASPGPKGKRVVRTFRHPSLLHPTGMLVHRGMLYVLEQTSAGMLKFHATSTEFVSTVLSNLPDAPEGILLVDEC